MLKLQRKENELTEVLEELYFSTMSERSPNLDQLYRYFSNLATHYALNNVDRVK